MNNKSNCIYEVKKDSRRWVYLHLFKLFYLELLPSHKLE
jgi:hypothetical protein